MAIEALVVGASGPIGAAISTSLREAGYELMTVDRSGSPDILLELPSDEMLTHLLELRPAHVVYAGGGSSIEEIETAGIPRSTLAAKAVADNLLAPLDLVRQISSVGTAASVTVLSSINADGGFGLPAYSAAKAGLRGFLKSSGASLAREGIRLNLLTLGTVKHAGVIERHTEDHYNQLLSAASMGRFTTPEEVADACLFIVRNEAVCGSEILLDSGQSLGY